MADRTIKPDDTNDLVLQNNDGSAKLELNENQTVKVTTGSDAGEDFTVNTSQLVVEGDTGDVGIGTADPGELLHLNGTEAVIKLVDSAVSGAGFIDFDGSSLQLNTNRNPNTGAHTSASKSHATIIMSGADGGSNILFGTRDSNNANATQRLEILSNGNVEVKTGNLVIGTAGRGIDFSVNSHASGMTSELLDGYEEGTWTPVFSNTYVEGSFNNATGFNNVSAQYTKIGRKVYCLAEFEVAGTSGNLAIGDNFSITKASLPFTPASGSFFEHLRGTVVGYNSVGSGFNASGPIVFPYTLNVFVPQITAVSGTNATSTFKFGISLDYHV